MISELAISDLHRLEPLASQFCDAAACLEGFRFGIFRNFWERLLATGQAKIFITSDGERITGAIGCSVHVEPYWVGIVAEELFWFVSPSDRGSGVALYRAFRNYATESGASSMQMVHLLDSMPDEVGKFYTSQDFQPVEIRYIKKLGIAGVRVFDNFLPDPDASIALSGPFSSFHFENCTFHGISLPEPDKDVLRNRIAELFPKLSSTLSFFRQSPEGQEEPHFIHTDIDMGDWTALMYLNRNPPRDDGTSFWEYSPSGEIGSTVPHERSEDGKTSDKWSLRGTIQAKFNRMIMFPSSYFHSRAIYDNWGNADNARLTQVVFGKGSI